MESKRSFWKIPGGIAARNFPKWLLLASTALLVTVFIFIGLPGAAAQSSAPYPGPTPTYDPLAIPVLPENPTEFDLGKNSYYYNCMPCHGDRGQGLTDEWRQTWEEDHRDCWGRGCHGGREKDEGFPIPTVIPAVILDSGALQKYTRQEDLLAYLRATHPPQGPGRLSEEDYRVLVVYLWASNGKDPGQAIQEHASPNTDQQTQIVALAIAGIIVIALLGVAHRQQRRKR